MKVKFIKGKIKGMLELEDNNYIIEFVVVGGIIAYYHWISCKGEPACETGWISLPSDYDTDVNRIPMGWIENERD